MSPFRLLDLPHIDRVFSLTTHWHSLFALSLCSSKTQLAIKKWARKSNLRSTWEATLYLSGESAILIFDTSLDSPLLFDLVVRFYSTRFIQLAEMDYYGALWELKNHFRMQSVVNYEQPRLTCILDPFDEQVAAVVEHLTDLFDVPIQKLSFEFSNMSNLEIYLKSNWAKDCKNLTLSTGSLPELPWILENFKFENLELENVNPGADLKQVIKGDEVAIWEHQPSCWSGAVLMLLDCREITLSIFNLKNEHLNLFIKKWLLEPPYNDKFRELAVSKVDNIDDVFGNPDIFLDGIDNRDVTPPDNDYIFYKEIVRGDGKKAIVSSYSFQRLRGETGFIEFKVCGASDEE